MPWLEHLVLNSKETADVDPSDGEYRSAYVAPYFADKKIKICKEKQSCGLFPLNFIDVVDILACSYKIALGCIPQARKLTSKHDIPFTRPGDYYAEMVKSDEHMERIRTKLVEEAYVFFLQSVAHLVSTLTRYILAKASRSPKTRRSNASSRSLASKSSTKNFDRESRTRRASKIGWRVLSEVRLMWLIVSNS